MPVSRSKYALQPDSKEEIKEEDIRHIQAIEQDPFMQVALSVPKGVDIQEAKDR